MSEGRNPRPVKPESDGQQDLPVALDAFDIVKEALLAAEGDTPLVRQALLACDEWIANVVSYSGAERFAFACQTGDGGFALCFADNGVPFDPTRDSGEATAFEDLDLGGMGLSLIRQLAAMSYERVSGQNLLTLRFTAPAEETDTAEKPEPQIDA